MEGEEVWVATTWHAHGEGYTVQGIYSSREAAWDGLKGKVETLYCGPDGSLYGKPRDEDSPRTLRYWMRRRVWALAEPMTVQGRKPAPPPPPLQVVEEAIVPIERG